MYNGEFILKIGDYIVPMDKYIKADSYSVAMETQDLDSYRDADGILHRNALEHIPIKVEFETPAMLTNRQFADLMSNIRRNYIDSTEKKVSATVYVPELDDYITQDMYIPTIQPTMYGTYEGVIHYDAIRIALIGY